MSLFLDIIEYFRRRKTVISYYKILPGMLKRKYRKKKYYGAKQIRDALKEAHLNGYWIAYAYAMFMQKRDYSRLGLPLDYETARYYIRYVVGGLAGSGGSDSSDLLIGGMDFIGDAFGYDSTTGVNFGSSYSGSWSIPGGGGSESFSGFGGGSFGGGGAGGSW